MVAVSGRDHDPRVRRPVTTRLLEPRPLLTLSVTGAAALVAVLTPTPAGLLVLGAALVLATIEVALVWLPVPRARAAWAAGQYAVLLTFVALCDALYREAAFRPMTVLYIPILTLVASLGSARRWWTYAVVAAGLYALVSIAEPLGADARRGILLGAAIVILSLGTWRTMQASRRTIGQLRESMRRERRLAHQATAVDEAAWIVARSDIFVGAAERVMDILHASLGYRYVSMYVRSGDSLRMWAHRGYESDSAIASFDTASGVIGRVIRTGTSELVRDVRHDPDYSAADDRVRSEVCVPLLDGRRVVGILNVEADADHPLDDDDHTTIRRIAGQLANAMALRVERDRLEARMQLFRALTSFAQQVNSTLDAGEVLAAIPRAIGGVVALDSAALTTLDRATGSYTIVAVHGVDAATVGRRIEPGEGLAGRAIRDRALVHDERLEPSRFPKSIRRAAAKPVTGAAVPLIRDDVVVGAISIARTDLGRPFTADELDALPALAEIAALAVSNTYLHAQTAELAANDSLTGLPNRRMLEQRLHVLAASPGEPVGVILFDLDHFGALNKTHGHQVGDTILRAVADAIRGGVRRTDFVARYGGEEFVAVLPGADLAATVRIAEQVRGRVAALAIDAAGTSLTVTTSAGCSAAADTALDFATILAACDSALSMAKRAGRNQVAAAFAA
jgi:diguanylate cyclase (GGDEF)-like protein